MEIGKTEDIELVDYSEREVDEMTRNALGRVLLFALKSSDNWLALKAIQKGANINMKDDSGNTFLHYAVYAQRVEPRVLRSLIDNGADVNKCNVWKNSPWHLLCAVQGAFDVGDVEPMIEEKMKILLRAGVRIDEKNNDGHEGLYYVKNEYTKALVSQIIASVKGCPDGAKRVCGAVVPARKMSDDRQNS